MGLYYSDVTKDVGTTLVTTVNSLKNKKTLLDSNLVLKIARLLQSTIGRPNQVQRQYDP